ncbi:DUF4436 family protein [Mycolicibacterium frederiksbergense]|uniref:DUF4436 family protein n=1 Tax=Mycolicibacterium frederiksbergense TaxID=117567 RepID=UPI00247591DA|nr:DUF4436 family protein [Mycolicibacterium frederiksbergense]
MLVMSVLGQNSLPIKHGQPWPDITQRFAVTGTITDYPFDRYSTVMTFRIIGADGTELPVAVSIWGSDPFFGTKLLEQTPSAGGPDQPVTVYLGATRSTPTLVFAVFVMVLMLGLAAAAVTASYYVLRWRRGLVFPACSMMAAVLFALIPLRNAVPGNPPIGSVIDFVSFFIAETVIAIALIASVVIGYRIEIANELSQSG